ncbi:MAG: polyketide synthase [Acutalibacteraceae bacterium]|nr:polyketide synthase [Acutalibacteraceae bacterium]
MSKRVVSLEYIRNDIALIRMQDEENKNTFTEEFVSELIDCFEKAESDYNVKCIIMTGFQSYFATGGTKDALLAIQEGRNNFLDVSSSGKNVYSIPLTCKVPVISAMQGHAIGGGLAMGLFSDFVIMSRESIYTASFMKYGFTPGFGSTCIFPEKLGLALGTEILMTAKVYRGVELEKKGVPFDIYPRTEVLDKAIELAMLLAEKPRKSLELLKERLTEKIREELPRAIEKELHMHDETFHLDEVKQNIIKLYN